MLKSRLKWFKTPKALIFLVFIMAVFLVSIFHSLGLIKDHVKFLEQFFGNDKYLHFWAGLLICLAALYTFWSSDKYWSRIASIVIGCIILVSVEEASQWFFRARTLSIVDLYYSVAGILVATITVVLFTLDSKNRK